MPTIVRMRAKGGVSSPDRPEQTMRTLERMGITQIEPGKVETNAHGVWLPDGQYFRFRQLVKDKELHALLLVEYGVLVSVVFRNGRQMVRLHAKRCDGIRHTYCRQSRAGVFASKLNFVADSHNAWRTTYALRADAA